VIKTYRTFPVSKSNHSRVNIMIPKRSKHRTYIVLRYNQSQMNIMILKWSKIIEGFRFHEVITVKQYNDTKVIKNHRTFSVPRSYHSQINIMIPKRSKHRTYIVLRHNHSQMNIMIPNWSKIVERFQFQQGITVKSI
jgi:hypothetical protein